MNKTAHLLGVALLAAVIGISGCAKKGPVEKVAEEVDESIATVKNGGKEPLSNKLDDAGDDIAKGVNKAGDAVTGK